MTLLLENDRNVYPGWFIEHDHRGPRVDAQHLTCEYMLDALGETQATGHSIALAERLRMTTQVEAQRVFGRFQHAEIAVGEIRDRPSRQRIDDPELGPLRLH